MTNALKRGNYEKALPALLVECKRMGLRTKVVAKAGSLVFRGNFAKLQMASALAEVTEGCADWNGVLACG